jgi:hypothetical protein
MRRLWLFLNGVLNPWVTVPTVCRFSAAYWDIHDYHVKQGGDGTPSHFYRYTCWHCGKEFII